MKVGFSTFDGDGDVRSRVRRGFLPRPARCAPDVDLAAQVLHLRWRYVLSADSGDCVRDAKAFRCVESYLGDVAAGGVRVLRMYCGC